jgi:hypothetical protein
MDGLRKLWWGNYSLPVAFWGFYVFGNLVMFLAPAITGAIFLTIIPGLRPIVFIVALGVSWAYWAVSSVGTWRSAEANKGDTRLWAIVVQIIVGLSAAAFVFRLINGGALNLISTTTGNWR